MKPVQCLVAVGLLCSCQAAEIEQPNYVIEDGFVVRSFSDGSASVALGLDVLDFRWSIDCRVDAMSDQRECSITSESGGIFIYYGRSATPQEVCILGHDFPGRRGMVRVDGNEPLTTSIDGCLPASRILGQLQTGSEVVTRRVEWPYDYSRDHEHTLTGLNKAFEIVGRIRDGSMPVTAS